MLIKIVFQSVTMHYVFDTVAWHNFTLQMEVSCHYVEYAVTDIWCTVFLRITAMPYKIKLRNDNYIFWTDNH